MTTSLSAGNDGGRTSTICRETFPPPRRLVTTSSGVINRGCRAAVDGTRHSANSHAVFAVIEALWCAGKYNVYGNPSKTFFRLSICFSPSPHSATHLPPSRTSAASVPSVHRFQLSPARRRVTEKLIHSQLACSRGNSRSLPEAPAGTSAEEKMNGRLLKQYSGELVDRDLIVLKISQRQITAVNNNLLRIDHGCRNLI